MKHGWMYDLPGPYTESTPHIVNYCVAAVPKEHDGLQSRSDSSGTLQGMIPRLI